MEVSKKLIHLIGEWEGKKNKWYLDSAGYRTIGVGHKLTPHELDSGNVTCFGKLFKWRDGLPDEAIDDLLRLDLRAPSLAVNTHVKVPLNQDQFDALVSFSFNAGIGALYGSHLLVVLNQGNYDAVPDELRKWDKCHINGVLTEVQGLKNRRENEIKLWQGEI